MTRASLLRWLIAPLVALALPFAALAQVPSFGQPPFQVPTTYNAAATFAPAVTANSDFFSLTGAASKLVRVTRASCQATVATTAALVQVSVIKRSAIPTVAGTSTSPTAVRSDQTQAAASAVVRAYTVAPTAGAAIGTVRIAQLLATVTGTAIATPELAFNFATFQPELQGLFLRSATDVLALNATWPATPAVSCNFSWTEQ